MPAALNQSLSRASQVQSHEMVGNDEHLTGDDAGSMRLFSRNDLKKRMDIACKPF
jgi:hypothetical protein